MANQQNRPQYENRSRLALASPAIRAGMHGRMLLSGPSGAGKTYTALLIASVLAGADRTSRSIVMLDTEKDSGKTYADEFNLEDGSPGYSHVPWAPPYNATDLAMTFRDISNDPDIRVVICDSHSHFWRGQGGILDVAGGRYTGWNEARPMHVDMVDAFLSCDAHVVLCARSAQELVQEQSASGKWEVRKLGMKIQQDADLEYEMNVALTIDMNHVLYVSKSRTRAVPTGTEYIAGHAEEFAGIYRDWLEGGEPAASKEQLDGLIGVLNRIEDAAMRQAAKRDFLDRFGRPEMLLVSRLPEASEWVADRALGVEETPNRAPDAEPPADAERVDHDTHDHGEEPPAGASSGSRPPDPPAAPVTPPDPPEKPAGEPTDEELDRDAEEARRALEARISAEVAKLTTVQLTDALRESELGLGGKPADRRARLVDWRYHQAMTADVI